VRRFLPLGFGAAAFLLVSPQMAQAHIVASRLGDFYAGALHPLSDLQDLIIWVALGALAGSICGSFGKWLVLIFPAGLLAGLAAGMALGVEPASALVNAGAAVMLGMLTAAQLRVPAAFLFALAFGLAAVRGAANAGGVGPGPNHALYAAGFTLAGYAVITVVMAAVRRFCGRETGAAPAWRVIAVRALGGWIAAIGLMMGALAVVS
jgi:urease accessory protein